MNLSYLHQVICYRYHVAFAHVTHLLTLHMLLLLRASRCRCQQRCMQDSHKVCPCITGSQCIILPIDLLEQACQPMLSILLSSWPVTTEMVIHSNHIGHQCARPASKLQPSSHLTTASVLKLASSPLAPVCRGVSPAYKKSIARSAHLAVSSAAAPSLPSMVVESDTTNSIRLETTQDLVDLAVVWACQHGLVGDRMFHHMCYVVCRCVVA